MVMAINLKAGRGTESRTTPAQPRQTKRGRRDIKAGSCIQHVLKRTLNIPALIGVGDSEVLEKASLNGFVLPEAEDLAPGMQYEQQMVGLELN
eukprot:g6676.t1